MGKSRRQRQKLHNAAPKSSTTDKPAMEAMDFDHSALKTAIPPSFPSGGVFSKLDIDFDMLTKSLDQRSAAGDGKDFDTRSAVTSKSLKGLGLKRKDKQQLRHEIWLKKVNIIEERRKEEKARKKREKTAVVGDMRPLEDSLPTLDLLMRCTGTTSSSRHSRGEANKRKVRGIEKESFIKKQMLEDISGFHAVLKHPAYVADPLATILEHLKNKMKQEK